MTKNLLRILIIVGVVAVLLVGGFFTTRLLISKDFLNIGSLNMKSERSADELVSYGQAPVYTSEEKLQSQTPVSGTSQTSFGLKIMKHGSLTMLSEKGKFFETWNKISSITSLYSGTVISSNYYKEGDYYFGAITVVIPSKDFDVFIKELSDVAKVDRLSVNSQDVTGEYVDLNSRLKVLESQRDLLMSWLKEAKTVDEMIKLRNEIQNLEEQIETIKGRLNYISFHTDFSDITITLSEKDSPVVYRNEFVEFLVYWLKKPLIAFVYSVIGLLIIAAFLIPWGLIGFAVYKLVVKRTNR